MHAYVILNPVAGQDGPEQVRRVLEQPKKEGRWTYALYETTGEEDLKTIVQDALEKDYDLIVAAGGDGTVSGVADGMAGSDLALGILPAGTVNSLAAALDIPEDYEKAVDLILSDHSVRAVDSIHDGQRHYLINVSMGVTAQSMKKTDREEKNRLGWWAYFRTGIKKILGLEPNYFTFTFADQEERFLAAEVILFNSDDLGVIDEDIGANVEIDDGVLNLYAVRSRTLIDLVSILWRTLFRRPKNDPHVRYWKVTDKVQIAADRGLSYQGDGDIKGDLPAHFSVKKGSVRIIVPKTAD
jgi:diacylglycerol kinase (ATP)